MDRMIAAFATAQSPKGLERWARRREMTLADRDKLAASQRALGTLARLFPDRVRVN